jgi:hypothetical protein
MSTRSTAAVGAPPLKPSIASPVRRGVLVMLPLLAGYVPFRRVIGGVAIGHAGLAALAALIVTSTKQSAIGDATAPTLLAVAAAAALVVRGASMRVLLLGGGGVYLCAIIGVHLLAR